MTIAHVLQEQIHTVLTCGPETSVHEAITTLASNHIGALPVIKDGKAVGVLSERDILRCLCKDGDNALAKTAADVMTSPAITVKEDTPVMLALALMTEKRARHLPVVAPDGQMVGFVSIGDLVKHRIERIEAEADAMRAYIQTV